MGQEEESDILDQSPFLDRARPKSDGRGWPREDTVSYWKSSFKMTEFDVSPVEDVGEEKAGVLVGRGGGGGLWERGEYDDE